jgi:hypothetical protein
LCVDGQVKLIGRPLGDQPAQREAQRGIGTGHHRSSLWRTFEERRAHAHVLGALAGKDEGVEPRRLVGLLGWWNLVGHMHVIGVGKQPRV